jgi:signal transduction histidine kinase
MSTNPTTDFLVAQKTALFERQPDGSFILAGPIPEWLNLIPGMENVEQGSKVDPTLPLEFMGSFLDDAHVCWSGLGEERVDSGLWREETPDGRHLQLQASAVRTSERDLLAVSECANTYRDKQHIVQKGRESVLVREALEKEIQKKEVLLHSIVHDLTGPLTSIKACLATLEESRITDEERAEIIKIGLRSTDSQHSLIRQILEVFSSEIDSVDIASMTADSAPDAMDCACDAAQMLQPAFDRKNVKVSVQASKGNWKVIANGPALVRVVTNLLENALRYSPENTAVAVTLVDDQNHILISVDDEGPGIPQSLSGALFNTYVKGSDRTGISGMGLYFCRVTVERWHGSIGCNPREEIGSRFWIRLRRPAQGT